MLPGQDSESDPPPSRTRICIRRTELIVNGILFGLWNNLSTVINAKTLVDEGHSWAAGLSLFFLFFPGIVTSVGFLILHWLGHKRIGRIPPVNVFIYCLVLLLFYPLVPIGLCFFTLVKSGKHRELAILSKLFEGFLDDGPQFVLRLVVFVLYGVGMSKDKDDVIFTLSMITSFGALVYFGLKFNERQTDKWTKWFLSFPMFAASLASRAFTLAVFLKETTLGRHLETPDGSVGTEWVGGLVVIFVYFFLNVATFKICGQDNIRSVVFGLSSTLIPAGYNNDMYFYQRPHQPMWGPSSDAYADGNSGQVGPEEMGVLDGEAKPSQEDENIPKMRSALFLILHTVINTVLLSSCAIYVLITRSGNLSESSGHALVLPQILAVIPGCFFTLARSILLVEAPPLCSSTFESCSNSERIWKGIRISLAIIFGVLAYLSLIPCVFWSLIWKVASVAITMAKKED